LSPATKSQQDGIVGLHGESVKIRINAPIEGRANAHLIKFLAKQFGVPKSAISVISRELGRQKRVKITQPGKTPDNLSITAND